MEKKTKQRSKDYIEEINRLKWECIRRNEYFIKDYSRFEKGKRTSFTSRKSKGKHFIIKQLQYFSKKYGICFPLSPNKKFPALLGAGFFDPIAVRVLEPGEPELLLPIRGGITPEEGRLLRKKLRTITLRVNLDFPKEIIIQQVKYKIQACNKLRKRFSPPKTNRKRIDKYSHYLEVFDLHNRGRSNEALAKKFYGNDAGGSSYAKKKVKRDYERAKKLIYGGYRQIK